MASICLLTGPVHVTFLSARVIQRPPDTPRVLSRPVCMDLIDDPELDDPHARLSTTKAVHKSSMSPVIAAAETFHEGGPSHPAFSESSVSHRWQGSLGFRAWVDCAEGGQWPKDFSPECCLLWCAPLSEIDMVQHLLFYTVFGCREREQRGVVPLR